MTCNIFFRAEENVVNIYLKHYDKEASRLSYLYNEAAWNYSTNITALNRANQVLFSKYLLIPFQNSFLGPSGQIAASTDL